MSWLFNNEYPYTDFHELNLSWVIERLKGIIEAIEKMDGWIEQHEQEYQELKEFYDDLMSGNFPPSFEEEIENWLRENAADIIPEIIKAVFFGLENGYFVAYIPDSWADLIFGTSGLDDFPAGVDFGHLTLSY